MQPYTDVLFSSSGPVPNVSVTVKTYPAGVVATLYSDNGSTTRVNPVITGNDGRFLFYAADGYYTLTVSATNILPVTIGPILLQDYAERTVFLTKFMSEAQITDARAGTGSLDLTTPWANAVAFVNTQIAAAISSGFPVATAKLKIPAGDYRIDTGASVANCNLDIEGDGPENTRIRIGAGQDLLTVTSTIYQFGLKGISFSGGLGTLKHTSTGINVQGILEIENNNFHDYTECALGSLSSDLPYVKIRNNQFYGAAALTSKGLALAGINDKSEISGNSFLRNRYHVKFGKGGINVNLDRNDFVRFTNGGGSPQLVDLWLVPNTSSNSSGQGFLANGNKFGNENINASDLRVLIADEAAGTDFITKNHATTPSVGFITGAIFRDNNMVGAGTPTYGYVYSYIPADNFRGCTFDDIYTGSMHPNIVQFDAGVTATAERFGESNVIRIGRGEEVFENSPRRNYSNVPSLGVIDDPFGVYAGFDTYRSQYPGGFDPGFTDLWTTGSSGARLLTQSSTTRTNIADSIGGADAAEYTFSNASGVAFGYLAATTIHRQAWVEIELKKSVTNPMARLLIDVRYDSDTNIPFRRIVNLSTNWQRIRWPWTPRTASAVQHVEFRVAQAADYSAGVTDRFQVGKIRVYHATEPQHFGARYLEASATFDPANLASGATGKTTVTVTGAVVGDYVGGVSHTAITAGYDDFRWTGQVTAADTVTVLYTNTNVGAIDLASGTLRVRVQKKDS